MRARKSWLECLYSFGSVPELLERPLTINANNVRPLLHTVNWSAKHDQVKGCLWCGFMKGNPLPVCTRVHTGGDELVGETMLFELSSAVFSAAQTHTQHRIAVN